jgi:hypothetical protein
MTFPSPFQNTVIAGKSTTVCGAIVMPPVQAFASMKLALQLSLASLLLAPIDLRAQADDLAYCTTLYDLAVKYRGRQIDGDPKPDPDMIIALEQCKHGKSAAGIATLERRLRSADITPPPRQKP